MNVPGVKTECQQYCPELGVVFKAFPDPEQRDKAMAVAGVLICANSCPGLGYSQETVNGHRCQAPKRTGDETGQEIIIAVAHRLGVEVPVTITVPETQAV